ncbi:MAG: nicotinate-nucleotide adenylyltransferase [Longimicrobiales bacterium]|nr:nicotinate-nucleotide adenylyltransferase [Longimicrobiales bacterium]
MGRRLGVFGGTFDPPHLGHRSVVEDVADFLGLDEVLWIPAGDPPHKAFQKLTPAPIRLRMVRAVTAGDERFRVSEIEVRREGPSYTVDTLRALREEHPDAKLFLIMGIDQYRALESWHRPDEVRSLATLAVMDRGGEALRDLEAGDADEAHHPDEALYPHETQDGEAAGSGVIRVPVKRVDISSTRVRAAVDRGESITELVSPEVARIIEAEGLYRRLRD